MATKPQLPVTGHHTAKDQAKSDRANKFIGRGSSRSSTERYRKAWGELANCGDYSPADIVFVSAEGNRGGRLRPDFDELQKAADAKASFVTDRPYDRNRPYNIGEREVEAFLRKNGFTEIRDGFWAYKS